MFTGLIQATGQIQPWGGNLQIICQSEYRKLLLADLAIGDSVAVDGICLTVVELLPDGFVATVSPETWQRTTLGLVSREHHANLELSLRVGSKLGGHFVTGHVDGVGRFQAAHQMADSWEMHFTVPDQQVARYIVPKGSIAVNGISLTIATCSDRGDRFKVAVIPHTFNTTNLKDLQPGDLVNLEGDILGKYVEKFLGFQADRLPEPKADVYDQHLNIQRVQPQSITDGFLAEHGYQ